MPLPDFRSGKFSHFNFCFLLMYVSLRVSRFFSLIFILSRELTAELACSSSQGMDATHG